MNTDIPSFFMRAVRGVITVGIIGYVAYVAVDILKADDIRFHAIGIPATLALLISYGAWLALFESSWAAVVSAVVPDGPAINKAERGHIFYKSMLARYIPGKVAFIAVRTEALRTHGIKRGETITAILMEQVCFQAGTVILMIATFPLFVDMISSQQPGMVVIALGAILAILGFVFFVAPRALLVWVARLPRRYMPARLGDLILVLANISARKWRGINGRFALLVVGQGLLVVPVAWPFLADGGHRWEAWVIVMAAYPVARFIGQLGMVVPAGIGVREGAYVLLTASVLSQGSALAIAAYLRLSSIIVEGLMYFAYSFAQRRADKREPQS